MCSISSLSCRSSNWLKLGFCFRFSTKRLADLSALAKFWFQPKTLEYRWKGEELAMDGEEWKCVAPCAPDLLIRVNTMCECLREWGSITNISLNICFTKREDLLRGHLFTYKFISSFLDHIIFNFYLPIWHLHIIHVNKIMATDRLFFKHACRQSRKNIDWHRSNIF